MYKIVEKKPDFILVEQDGKQYHIPSMPTPDELEHCGISVLGRVTTVMYDNTYTGTATCCPTDTFDLNTGVAWAYKKAIEAKKKAEEDKNIKVGDIVKVVDAGKNFKGSTNWVVAHITDPELIARFAYNNWLSESIDRKGEFKVHYIDENKAYIEHIGNGCCRVIGVDGIKKAAETEGCCVTDKEEEDGDGF